MDWRCSCASVKEMYMYWLISDILHRPDAHCSSGHAPTATVPVAFHIIASSAPSVRLFNKATHCRPSARIALLPSPACTTIVCAQGRKFRLSLPCFPRKEMHGKKRSCCCAHVRAVERAIVPDVLLEGRRVRVVAPHHPTHPVPQPTAPSAQRISWSAVHS